ncbi:DUF262 domain-containing protein [Streptomyces sp. NBC_00343]|uniref:DUF262 domain-containing protein n=1 Tax=Streptomyces sp. NBC_00343 TaxID=2975719 RepID=UPI002E2D6E08|nr:DUF262 domain-containing protein [Streptomyces sp. NBC_00343]
MRDTGIELKRFLDEAEGGAYDLPPMQRALCVRPAFSVRLIDSLYRGYRVGSMLIWEPPVGQRPSAGRYQGLAGRPRWWILDGQQRGTSYAGAFGRRPAWLPEELWASVGGPELEVAVRFTSAGDVQFRTHRPGRARHVRLADLVAGAGGEVRLLLEEAGYSPTDVLVERALDLRAGLLRYVLPIEWLAADWADAAENFIRRNPNLKPEERSLCSLSIVFEELQREHIDALVRTAGDAGFATTLDRRQLNLVLQDFLPHGVRRGQGRWAERSAVSRAMERTEQSVNQVIAFLHRHGITSDALLWSPPVARVLCALFDRFPQAVSSPFTWQWLAHAAAGQFYPGGPYSSRPRQDVRSVLAAASFEEAAALLAGHGSPGPPARLCAEELMRPSASRRRLLGAAGTLYAMACAHRVCGPVVDLSDSAMVFPDPRMRPRLLWPGAGAEASLAAWALLGEDSAERIRADGGWGHPVFEDLDVPPGCLAAHQLAVPPGGAVVLPVEQQLKLRAEAMADAVNVFLETVGPLDLHDDGL